jgi:hypothetical protein
MSILRFKKLNLPVALIMILLLLPQVLHAASDVKVEDIITGHLDSVAKAETRAAAKSRVVEGTAQFKILTGGAGTMDGKAVLVSLERKLQLMMKFPNNDYRGETFITDGNKVSVASATASQMRSSFGEFIHVQDVVVREGLLGGVLSTAWPLLDLKDRNPKLSYEGRKTIDGRDLYDVRYKPKKNADVEVHLYFDPESFHHVLTVYTLTIQPRLVQGGQQSGLAIPELGGPLSQPTSSDAAQSQQQQDRYRVEEKFSDFKTVDGLTLPNHYVIHFTREPQSGKTTILDWDITATRILDNIDLNPKNFEVK